MDEFAAALTVIFGPSRKLAQLTVTEPILLVVSFFLDFFYRYFVDSQLGHIAIRTTMAPFLTYSLARVYDCRAFFRLFREMPDSTRIVAAGFSSLLNIRLLNEPLKQMISDVGTTYCDVMYGKEARQDAYLFFYLCSYKNGRIVGEDMGTGNLNDSDNCFFPRALANGPVSIASDDDDEYEKVVKFLIDEAFPEAKKRFQSVNNRRMFLVDTYKNAQGFPVDDSVLKELMKMFLDKYHKSKDAQSSTKLGDDGFRNPFKGTWPSDRQMNARSYETKTPSENGEDEYETERIKKTESGTSVDTAEMMQDAMKDIEPVLNGKRNAFKFSRRTSIGETKTVPEKPQLTFLEKKAKIEAAEKNNLQVAMTCLFFSMLTYQGDKQLVEAQKAGMLPGVEIFTVDTGSSGTAMIAFVDKVHEYAVIGYRGTQFEVIRQMLTSLDFRLEYFETGSRDDFLGLGAPKGIEENPRFDPKVGRARIRKVYNNEVKKSSELFKFQQPIGGEYLSPLELIKHLSTINFKIYLTGHSLGGGLATVMAARLMSLNIKFDGLITFGATPVGDVNFVKWFNKTIKCSWRFVFGDEFAPMVPPIPWAQPAEEVKLVHVGDFHHIDLPKRIVPTNAQEANKVIEDLAFEAGMMDLIVHHNPLMTMRALKYFYYGDEQDANKRMRLDINQKCPVDSK